MATHLTDIVFDAADPARLARFWSALLERPELAMDTDKAVIGLNDTVSLTFSRLTDQTKVVKNRLHPDLASLSPDDQRAVVERALAAGARRVDVGQGAVPWCVLADPEGNEFCVLEPRDEYMGIGRLAAIVIDALDPRTLVRFWSHATGLPVTRDHPEYASLSQPGSFWVEFVRVDQPKRIPNRVRIAVASPGPLADDAARLRRHGATMPDIDPDAPDAVAADPDGNEFTLRHIA
ncbi:MAG: VOC family protein [Actinobacteria bacterium]|nr:VOC family protein [Actinomycetota bacterium]